MNISYAVTPFIAWFIAGAIKFSINSIKSKKLTFNLIGYGGLPSNHSAIVSSTAALIAMNEGIDHPAFGASITLAFIVALDASSLRRQIGMHATAINRITNSLQDSVLLRERMGHTPVEIAAGVLVGVAVAIATRLILN